MQIGVETARAVENRRVFVVDDDEIIRTALQFMLHDEHETHELASLESACAKSADGQPDLVLLGLGIVRAWGLAVLAETTRVFPAARIAVIAGPDEQALAQSCLTAGAHGVVTKPLTIEGVRGVVDILLGRVGAPLITLQVL